jgi:hypothetical protein
MGTSGSDIPGLALQASLAQHCRRAGSNRADASWCVRLTVSKSPDAVIPSMLSFLVAIVFGLAPGRSMAIAFRAVVVMWGLGII